MRILVVAVGALRAGPERALAEKYLKRITWPVAVREVQEKRKFEPVELRRREAELIFAARPAGAVLVALDERGCTLTSAQFARRLGDWRDTGVADIVFAIGGADGLDEMVRRRADLVFAFGAQTLPHQLMRGVLLEQIYRAQTILAGHPYHRD